MNRNYSSGEIILHIPHSSTVIPGEFRESILPDEPGLRRELLRMTDRYTDELFACEGIPPENRIVFPYSRLVCDVERFRDDSQEVMAERGMGVFYTRTSDLEPLRKAREEDKAEALRLYDAHHRALTARVDSFLERYERCLLLDCHSFSSVQLPYERWGEPERAAAEVPRPDICIGRDLRHTPERLSLYLAEAFSARGYKVGYDDPFSGALIPMKHYHRDLRVLGAMIEVRRGLYMDELTGERSAEFNRVKKDIREVLEGLCFRG